MLSGSPDLSSTYRLPWESVHVLVILTPSAVDQNVLIRSVSRQSIAMAARRLVTGSTFSQGNICWRSYGRGSRKVCRFRCLTGRGVIGGGRRVPAGGEWRRPDRHHEKRPRTRQGSGSGERSQGLRGARSAPAKRQCGAVWCVVSVSNVSPRGRSRGVVPTMPRGGLGPQEDSVRRYWGPTGLAARRLTWERHYHCS